MKEDFSNPNIEWKKNNSDPSERLTLRINHKEAAAYSATKKNSFNAPAMPVAENLPKGLKKIRKKIRKIDVRSDYEDEDDEDFQYIPDSLEQLNQANSLMNALNDEEKRLLQQQESLQNMKMQQTAGKMEALAVAANMARQAGLTGTEKKRLSKPANQCAAGRDYRTCRTRHFERPGKNQRQKSSGRKGYSDAARRKKG